MLNEEYGFDMADMARDFTISYEDTETGNTKRMKIDLVIFESGKSHEMEHIIRICIVQDEKAKEKDAKKGVEAPLEKHWKD